MRSGDKTLIHQAEIRAAPVGYVVLNGPFIVLSIVYLYFVFKGVSGSLGCFLLLFSWVVFFGVWLAGFRLSLSNGYLIYRDGYFRTVTVPVRDIKSIKPADVMWKVGFRKIPMPRYVVRNHKRKTIVVINAKPFKYDEFNNLIKAVLKESSLEK